MHHTRIGLCTALCVLMTACHQRPDPDALHAEILELHRAFIQAHLDKNAPLISRQNSDDYLAVTRGSVDRIDTPSMEEMLTAYLESTEFSEYSNVAEPIVGTSDDGTLAWAVFQVRVAGTQATSDTTSAEFDTIWAWLSLFERDGDGWKRLMDVSTSRRFGESD